jgi:membrane protease YdiL (CAAX protease family)
MISGAAGAAAATGIEALVLPGVVGPAIAAFVVARVAGGQAATADLRAQIVRWRVAPVWYAVAVVVLPILAVVAIAISTGRLPGASGSLFPRILILLVLMTGEEIGWRGFMLPRLQHAHSALSASLILGIAWGLWHFPGYLIGTGVPLDMSFLTLLLWVVGATILVTWVYNHTRSVLLAIIMHVCANLDSAPCRCCRSKPARLVRS